MILTSSLRAERSNPALNAGRPWIASSLPLLAMTTKLIAHERARAKSYKTLIQKHK